MTQSGQNHPTNWGKPTYGFAGLVSFLRAPVCHDLDTLDADIAVMGAPTDEGSPFMPGSRFGSRSIREHSLRFGNSGYFDHDANKVFLEYELANNRIVDVGDADVLITNVEGTFENITNLTRMVLDKGAMPVVIGGDHAVTFPVVRAYSDPLHVVHFDAHIDYSPFVHGFEYTNTHAFRHIYHMDHVESLTQVGIRSVRNNKDWVDDSINDGNRVIGMREFGEMGPDSVAALVPPDADCYVSIDIDVIDAHESTGTGSPEFHGVTTNEFFEAMDMRTKFDMLGAFDLCEVSPEWDPSGQTVRIATSGILKILAPTLLETVDPDDLLTRS